MARTHGYTEGRVAKTIEQKTKMVPSDWFLWTALGSICASLTLKLMGRDDDSEFVGQWAPTLLILGVYNKIVKLHGSDAKDANAIEQQRERTY